jgi:hypothetical protein
MEQQIGRNFGHTVGKEEKTHPETIGSVTQPQLSIHLQCGKAEIHAAQITHEVADH